MQQTHEKRRISIFSGPPGIGKTSAIDRFQAENDGLVAVVKISNKNTTDRVAYQHMMGAFDRMRECESYGAVPDSYSVKNKLCREMAAWGCRDKDWTPPLTFVFDEAQNLSRHAVDALRYWNDPDRCYGPFPIGVIFIGNDEFALRAGRSGESVISAAVADRVLYQETFSYASVKDSDLAMFLESRGIVEPNAVQAMLRRYRAGRVRSFRKMSDDIDELKREADGGPITLATFQAVFNP